MQVKKSGGLALLLSGKEKLSQKEKLLSYFGLNE